MSEVKMVLELGLKLNPNEQKKLLSFLDRELCIEKEDVKIVERQKHLNINKVTSKPKMTHH